MKNQQLANSINDLSQSTFKAVRWKQTSLLRGVSVQCEDSGRVVIQVRWLVNWLVRSARTATDMSQDVCHRQRRSLNEFQSGRAKKTRAEHARVKSSEAGATLREARSTPRMPPAPSPRTTSSTLPSTIKTFLTYLLHCTSLKLINLGNDQSFMRRPYMAYRIYHLSRSIIRADHARHCRIIVLSSYSLSDSIVINT